MFLFVPVSIGRLINGPLECNSIASAFPIPEEHLEELALYSRCRGLESNPVMRTDLPLLAIVNAVLGRIWDCVIYLKPKDENK